MQIIIVKASQVINTCKAMHAIHELQGNGENGDADSSTSVQSPQSVAGRTTPKESQTYTFPVKMAPISITHLQAQSTNIREITCSTGAAN